ncbi:MAG TPA: hypothetical protein VK146_12735 [Tabrizicola sp.]|nr:hypothetical protein [Tabrizicola sp.]
MPRLIRFMLEEFANGAVLGLVVALFMLWIDLGRIASLLATSGHETALTLLFFSQAGLLFGTLGMGVAVMNLADDR